VPEPRSFLSDTPIKVTHVMKTVEMRSRRKPNHRDVRMNDRYLGGRGTDTKEWEW
jgi:hypothetical protein